MNTLTINQAKTIASLIDKYSEYAQPETTFDVSVGTNEFFSSIYLFVSVENYVMLEFKINTTGEIVNHWTGGNIATNTRREWR